jgi:hypothetical protein
MPVRERLLNSATACRGIMPRSQSLPLDAVSRWWLWCKLACFGEPVVYSVARP